MEKTLLEMRNITKRFGKVTALSNVNLKVREGEVHALVGENGAGKSTLMNVLSGIYPYGSYEGDIIFDGNTCEFHGIRDSEEKGIVIIHQELALVPFLSIAENLFLGNERTASWSGKVVDWPRTYKRASELLELVGLEGRGNAPISTLSGGQKQRVAIARALAVNPDILFCDEATSALDPQTTRSILSLIKEIQKKMNLTVVMITHQMEVVRDSCDYVAVLDSGRIVEEGKVADVFANPSSPTTKDFLSNLASAHDSVVRWSKDGGRYTLRFRGSKTDAPILSTVSNETGAIFNIRAAGIQNVNGEELGVMVCDIGPDKETEERAVSSLMAMGIIVEEEK